MVANACLSWGRQRFGWFARSGPRSTQVMLQPVPELGWLQSSLWFSLQQFARQPQSWQNVPADT